MYYIYILQSEKNQSFYVGHTRNLENRLNRHNAGQMRYTKSHYPYRLIRKEIFDTRAEAMKREKQIKSFQGGEGFKKLFD